MDFRTSILFERRVLLNRLVHLNNYILHGNRSEEEVELLNQQKTLMQDLVAVLDQRLSMMDDQALMNCA